jgi:predicted permease
VRDIKAGAFLDTLAQDGRYAARLLRRHPLFTLTATLSLAIGIGATTTVFTIANGLLLRPADGVREPDRVVDISHTETVGPFAAAANPQSFYSTYLDLRGRARTLDDTFAYQLDLSSWSLSGDDGAERVFGILVSPNYFTALGVQPTAGRLFGDGDSAGEIPLVVLSHAFWTRRYDRDPAIVGRTVRLSGQPFTVLGVASEGFKGISVLSPDMWVPAPMVQSINPGQPILRGLQVMIGGRLKPDVSVAQARAEIEILGRALNAGRPRVRDVNGVRLPGAGDAGLSVAPSSPIPGGIRLAVAAFLTLLMTLVSLVLAIACANLAGVLLARASARRREIAVRLAVGVGRARLVRQLLTETMLLFLLGCGAGLLLARGMTTLLTALLPSFPQPVAVMLSLDWRVVAFSVGLSLVAAVLSGIVPALHASKGDVVASLKDESHGPPERLRMRNAFVVVQIAFSLVLVVAAGLFVQRVGTVTAPARDFDPTGVAVVSLDLSMAGYAAEPGAAFVRRLTEQVRRLPGVDAATVADRAPAPGRLMSMSGDLTVPGVQQPDGGFSGNWSVVEPEYFATLRIPIVAGREFTGDDTSRSQQVAIVSESTAKRLWPGRDALGRIVSWHAGGPRSAPTNLVVVGVVKDLEGRAGSLPPGPRPMTLYVPFQQRYTPNVTILARASGRAGVASPIASLIRSLDPDLPVLGARTLEEELMGPVDVQLRIAASVSGTVGLIGLLLAGIGVYGVTAYAVTRRTREIGVRLALGADRFAVVAMVLRQGMSLVAAGSAIGLALAAGASRLMTGALFGMPPLEALTAGGAVILFAIVGLAASYVPVRRASRIDATDALRYE